MNVHVGFLEKEDSLLGFQYKVMNYYEGKTREELSLNTYYEFSFGILFARVVFSIKVKKGN